MDETTQVLAAALVGGTAVALILATPEWMAHYTWWFTLRRSYVVRGEVDRAYRDVTYDHSTADGELFVARLRRVPLPPPLSPSTHEPAHVCTWHCTVPRSELCSFPRGAAGGDGGVPNVRESEFLQLVAHFCANSTFLRRDGHVISTVLVSTRHKLHARERERAGSFLRSARVNVDATLGTDAQSIADAHRRRIEHVLHPSAPLCDSIADRAAKMTTHYVFNKWMLHTVVRDDGVVLDVVRGGTEVELSFLLALHVPLELKCVKEENATWSILASPLHTWLYPPPSPSPSSSSPSTTE